jgi:hypothetical protein
MSLFLVTLWLGSARADGVNVEGYVRPALQGVLRPTAVPADQREIDMRSSLAGLVFEGVAAEHWSFRTHLRVGAEGIDAIIGVSAVDTDNDGAVDDVVTSRSEAMGQFVREASVSYRPIEELGVIVGRLKVPFTSQAQASDTALLFSDRAGPGKIFHAEDDLGALVEVDLADRIQTSMGLFNGDGMGVEAEDSHGVLYMSRVDINPLGNFDFDESRPQSQDLRFGLGGGLIWHSYTVYDSAGYDNMFVGDLRATASARLAFAGLSLSAEYLYRLQRDDLTDRPLQATGAFGQGGWRLPIGVEPMFRLGVLVEDQTFAPRTTRWVEGGLNLYPNQHNEDPNAIRLTLEYTGENRVTEQEVAHGLVALVQVLWD